MRPTCRDRHCRLVESCRKPIHQIGGLRRANERSQIESAEVAIEHSLRRAARLRQSILKQAFEGKLVPQDPTDEPASTLLKRLCSSKFIHEANAKKAIPARTRGRGAKPKQVVELPEQQPIQ